MNMWTRPAAVYEYGTKVMNNQVGDYKTSAGILTLSAEATRMPIPNRSSFSPKLLREENKHFRYSFKQFLSMGTSSLRCVFGDGQN